MIQLKTIQDLSDYSKLPIEMNLMMISKSKVHKNVIRKIKNQS